MQLEIRNGDTASSYVVQDCFGYPGFFVFPYEAENCSLQICKELCWNFYGDALNLKIAFDKMTIFTKLILLIPEHGKSFHLLKVSLVSFFRDLKFLSYRFFTCLVRVTPRYFILFEATVKSAVSLLSQPIYACIEEHY